MKAILAWAILAGSVHAGDAEKSKALVADSKRCLAAFQCYHFAVMAKGEEELAAKLFVVGYVSGLRFFEGVEKGKLLEEDRKEIAIAYGFYGRGPSHDFIVGRLFQEMKGDLDRELKDVGREMWDMVVSGELRKRNAELVADSFRPDSDAADGRDPFWEQYKSDLEKAKKQLGEQKGVLNSEGSNGSEKAR